MEFFLTRLNIGHLKQQGANVPDGLKEYIDQAALSKIRAYNIESQNFGIFGSFVSLVLFIFVLLSGILPAVAGSIANHNFGPVLSGLAFFAVIGIAEGLSSVPFNYYHTFVIEQRYGFNTSTIRIWIVDILKSAVVAAILAGVLLWALLSLVEYAGALWWMWAWLAVILFQIVAVLLFPTVIAPWFNKFSPLEDKVLEEKVEQMARRNGISIKGVFKMDAGKRSRHSNAYFTGFGAAKRIVLFDTLLASHTHEEILAILVHEIGHWKKKHIIKNLLMVSAASLLFLFLASVLLKKGELYEMFGFQNIRASYVGLFLIGALWDAVSRFLPPIGAYVSRLFERQADSYAARHFPSMYLVSALKRLASDNLSNLSPHPLYAWFYYSHPPLLERIRYLERFS